MRGQNHHDDRAGFTLIELLVVIAIIAILIGLLLPAVQKVRAAAARSQCSNNLHQLALTCHMYHDNNNTLPAGGFDGASSTGTMSWLVFILPYEEQGNLYSQFNVRGSWADVQNLAAALNKVPTHFCPASTGTNLTSGFTFDRYPLFTGTPLYTTHYYGNLGPTGTNPADGTAYVDAMIGIDDHYSTQGVLGSDTAIRLTDVTDGTSNTILMGERSQNDPPGSSVSFSAWTRGCTAGCAAARNVTNPINAPVAYRTTFGNVVIATASSNNLNDLPFGSNHSGGANFALCDGSVRFIAQTINMNVYLSAASRNGGEVLQLDP